jgi:hypothetical protein
MRSALLVIGVVGMTACRGDPTPGAEVSPGVVLVEAVGRGAGRVDLLRKRLDDGRGEYAVVAGGKVIYGPTDRVVGLVATPPGRERSGYHLLEIDYGAPACRLWYRVIDLRGDRPLVSGDFGTCWRISAPPAERDGALRIQLFAERSGGSVVDFAYRDGAVAEVPASARPVAPPAPIAPTPAARP